MLLFGEIPSSFFFNKTETLQKDSQKVQERKSKFSFQEKEIKDIVSSLKTLSGSLKYQKQLDKVQYSEINTLLLKLSPFIAELMCSEHANYFIQKLLQKLAFKQRLYVFQLIEQNFIQICKDPSGTHAIQGLISVINTEIEEKILENLLQPHLLELFCNKDTHHIIQKIILDFPEPKRAYINEFILENIDEICLNEYGFHCMLKFLMMSNDQVLRLRLAREISSITIFTKLVSNKFGSAILIYLVSSFGIGYFENLFKELREVGNLIFYSKLNVYSSTFVGKFYECINSVNHSYYLSQLFNLINPKEEFVNSLLGNVFGERVLFHLLKNSNLQILNYFVKNYQKTPNGKTFCKKLNFLVTFS